VQHSETEKQYLNKESELTKEVSVTEFELNGLIQMAGNYSFVFHFQHCTHLENNPVSLMFSHCWSTFLHLPVSISFFNKDRSKVPKMLLPVFTKMFCTIDMGNMRLQLLLFI